MISDLQIWRGEERVAGISADDRGLAYGDGVFETIRITAGQPVLMNYHWARLSLGCARLGLPDLPFWRLAFTAFLRERGDGVAKIQVTRGTGGRGYLPASDAMPTLILSWHAVPDYPAAHQDAGIRIAECQMTLAIQPVLAGIKHLNRLEQVLLRRELASYAGCSEAIVSDASGQVVEGVFSNLFLVRDGVLLTPDLAAAGIRGVLRDALLDACAAEAVPVQVGALTRQDCWQADELFFANSVFGIWPVAQWQDRTWQPGPVTRQCQQLIAPWFALT